MTKASGASKEVLLLVIGDSLSAGYGVEKTDAYPAQLESLLNQAPDLSRFKIKVLNGSESNILSSAALPRLEFYLARKKPDLLLLALGGNDGRKLTKPEKVKENLKKAIVAAQAAKVKVLIAEMKMFPNLGREYIEKFEGIYTELAAETAADLVPFFLQGVAGVKSMNQADGFHPNEAGHKKMAENLLPFIKQRLPK